MKNTDLLKGFGKIREEYLEDPEQNSVSKAKKGRPGWIKWSGAVAAVLVVAIVGTSIGGSLGKKGTKSDESQYIPSEPSSYMESSKPGYSGTNFGGMTSYDQLSEADRKSDSTSSIAYTPDQVKLIYKADISAQTTDFAKSKDSLQSLVEKTGGYFENQNISNGRYYNESYLKVGKFVVRIPSEKYREFVDSIGEDITITSLNETVDDVGLAYAETEQRLETYKIKLDRLQKLLSEATNMSDIITLEDAISDTEYYIDEYQNALNKYDSLIGFSTITINIEEVVRPDSGIENKEGFFKKLARNFVDGLEGTGENIAEFFYWVSYNFVEILIFVAAVLLFIKFRPIKKLIKKLRKTDN